MIPTARAAWTHLTVTVLVALSAPASAQVFDEGLRHLVEPDSSAAPDSTAVQDSLAAPALVPGERDSVEVTKPQLATPDSSGAAADSTRIGLPEGFGPRDAAAGAFLRPAPAPDARGLARLTPFDAFLLPPEGPALFFDRADLRLTGHTEWWDLAYLVPGLFTLRPGYPGTTTPFSFRARGPDGTMVLYDGRPLAGGYTPIENPNSIGKGHLAGVGVMRVGASHLYGPGAGAGALLLMPVGTAPDRPFSEATKMTGVFGQRSGSFTTAFHWTGVGVLFEYAGSAAKPWTLFDGYRAERAHGRLDFRSGGTTMVVSARTLDEKLKHFERLEKRSDDGHELSVALSHRAGEWLGAVRGVRHDARIRADGPDGFAWQDLERWSGEALLQRSLGERGSVGLLAGVDRDRRERRDVSGRLESRQATAGHALVRLRTSAVGGWLDAAARADHLTTGDDALAAGATLTFPLAHRGGVWLHAARTVDRPAYFQRISDAYTQVDQGIDLPWPEGTELPAGVVGALGLNLRIGRLTGELGGSVDRTDRVFGQVPEPHDGPLALDDPDVWQTEQVESAGGWASLTMGPIWLGRVLGSFSAGGSVFVSSTPELRRLQVEPDTYGEIWARLRKDLFHGALRMEAEADWEALDEMPTFFGDIPPQSQLNVRISAQIGDAIVTYRSENVLGEDFFSSGYEDELGYVPITSQNVTVGASWVLVD